MPYKHFSQFEIKVFLDRIVKYKGGNFIPWKCCKAELEKIFNSRTLL
jgi:hypothetical protein